MSHKDLWIERYDERYLECLDLGMSEAEACHAAEQFAEGLIEDLQDHADNLRKAAREQGL